MAVTKNKKTPKVKEEVIEEKELSGIKKVWATIKLIWANRQYRAAIKLFLYLIFMTAILIIINIGSNSSNNQVVIKSPLERFSELDNYQYQTIVNENNNLIFIDGNRLNSEDNFTIGNVNYITSDKQIYTVINNEQIVTSQPILFNVFDLTPAIITKMINSAEEVSKTNYKNGMIETNYELPVSLFTSIYASKKINSEEIITIKTRLEDNKITRISLNLSNYLKLENQTVNTYLIEINYLDNEE